MLISEVSWSWWLKCKGLLISWSQWLKAVAKGIYSLPTLHQQQLKAVWKYVVLSHCSKAKILRQESSRSRIFVSAHWQTEARVLTEDIKIELQLYYLLCILSFPVSLPHILQFHYLIVITTSSTLHVLVCILSFSVCQTSTPMHPYCVSRGYDHINTLTKSAWMAVRLDCYTGWSAISSLTIWQRKIVDCILSPQPPHTMAILPSTNPAMSMSLSVSALQLHHCRT